MERRLAAVMIADVAGYGRLSQADEEGTRARFKADLQEVFEPQIAVYHGRLVKTMGDGLLVEFHSVVDALRCAIEVQRIEATRNAGLAADRQLAFRVGINLGDVIVEGDDIQGDGVNIADRLQALADPGGVIISGTAYDHVKTKIAVGYAVLGDRRVKNIAEPVRTYRVLIDAKYAGKTIQIAHKTPRRLQWSTAAAVALVIAAGAVAWWRPWEARIEPASVERMALPLPDKPSIAVLPFANMSGDPEQEFFAEGVADDLITELSKVSGLFVISRNSTFVYKGQVVPPKRVAEELGVRYVLEGSVQRAGDNLRINAQLIDALTGGHEWADKFDGSLAEVFALQDKVTRSIADALAIRLTDLEQRSIEQQETAVPAAYDAFLRGWELLRRRNPNDLAKAIPYFEEAIRLDPDYGRAHAALAMAYFKGYEWEWAYSLGISDGESRHRARKHVAEALKHPTALSHQTVGWMLWVARQFDQAIAEFKKAIELDPGDSFSYAYMGGALYSAHRAAEAITQIRFAMRLDPHYPSEYVHFLGLAQFALEQYEEAAASFQTATKLNPDDEWPFAALAATCGHLGRKKEAASAVTQFNQVRVERGGTPLTVVGMPWLGLTGSDSERLAKGFRLAGVPETLDSGEFAGLPRLTADEIRTLLLGQRLHGRAALTREEHAASFTTDGVASTSGAWSWSNGGIIAFKGDELCFKWGQFPGTDCVIVLRNPGGTRAKENEYIWVERRGTFPFSQVE
jgi:adenylate cyclase